MINMIRVIATFYLQDTESLSWESAASNTVQIHSAKNKKYPGNSFHASVNRGENTLLFNACLATLTTWLCRKPVHFGFMCKF